MELDDGLAEYEAITRYFDSKESKLSNEVVDLNRRVLRYFFEETFPNPAPKETTTDHIRDFLARLDKRGLKNNSKRRYLEVLSSFFSYALRDDNLKEIYFNPPGIVLETYPTES